MILDKLLAQGEHTIGNPNDPDYENYKYDYDPKSRSVIVRFQTAEKNCFQGNTEEEKSENQLKKRKVMLSKIKEELKTLSGEIRDGFIHEDDKAESLVITNDCHNFFSDDLIMRAQCRGTQIDSELIKIGSVILDTFSRLYSTTKPPCAYNSFKILSDAIKNMGYGLLLYRNDNLGKTLSSEKPHKFYIGQVVPNFPNHKVPQTAKISDYLGRQLRIAFKTAMAKILNKNESEIFVEYTADELSFNLSDVDFGLIKKQVDWGDVIIVEPESTKSLSDPSIKDEHGMRPKAEELESISRDTDDEIKKLKEDVFSQFNMQIPLHHEKNDLIRKVKDKFLAVKDIQQLSKMYEYINAQNNKRILNIHEHPIYDSIFIKTNTSSWQTLIEQIRDHALETLFSTLLHRRVDDVLNDVKTNTLSLTSEDATDIKKQLEPYLKDPLFCEHRSNYHFLNLFHSTAAVKKIQIVIDYCDAQIKKENALRARG